MKIKFVRLENFRNIGFGEADLGFGNAWIYGRNAQGKTNLLEAAGLLPALRSFRTAKVRSMVAKGSDTSRILFEVSGESFGNAEIEIRLEGSSRRAFVDGEETRMSDFIGRFPVLAMTSEDVRFLRDSPDTRRREIDMFLSEIDPEYFSALKKYHSALSHRNALLKEPFAGAPWNAFEEIMAISAETISSKRGKYLEILGKLAGEKYSKIAIDCPDSAEIRLKSSEENCSAENFRRILFESRNSDIERGYTRKGPHRDDFAVTVSGLDTREYSSEGQQRSAAIALKFAEFEMFKTSKGETPVLLCDDILGELDSARKEAFWNCAPPDAQIIASSTTPPPFGENKKWLAMRVENGKFSYVR